MNILFIRTLRVKVSQNALEQRYGAQKFKPRAFQLQNYWISQLEPTFLCPVFTIVIR